MNGTIIALITASGALAAAAVALVKVFLDRPATKATAVNLISEAATRQMTALEGDNDKLRARMGALEEKMAVVVAKLDAAETKLDLAESDNAALRERNAEYLATITGLRQRLDLLEEELTEARHQEKQLVQQLDEAHKQVRLLLQQRDILIAHIQTVEQWHLGGQQGDMPRLQPFD